MSKLGHYEIYLEKTIFNISCFIVLNKKKANINITIMQNIFNVYESCLI